MTQIPPDTAEPQGHGGFRRDGLHDLGDLRRSVTDRKLAGVAGGLGRHFDIDPTVLRVGFVVLTLFGGAGALLYAVSYLFVPEEGSDRAVIRTSPGTRVAVLGVAALLAVAVVVSHTFGHWWFPWPLALVAVVVLLVWMNRDKNVNSTQPPPPSPPGQQHTSPTPPPAPAEEWTGVPPPPPAYPQPTGYQPPRRGKRGPLLFGPTLALLAVALGALGLYDALGGPVVPAAYPALALTVVGAMLVVGAWFGRAGGLVLLGLAAAVALLATAVVSPHWHTGRSLDPGPATIAVRDHYFLPAGEIHLDLTQLPDPSALDGRHISAHTRAGDVTVILPPGVRAHVVADVSLGDVALDGRDTGGAHVHLVRDLGTGPTTVYLDLGANVGRVDVRHASTVPQATGRHGAGLLSQGAA